MTHWGLTRIPFGEVDSPYVSFPTHEEAIARIVFAVESAKTQAALYAPAGLGKTVVMRQVLDRVRSPRRRLAVLSCPGAGSLLFAVIAERLGYRRRGREAGQPGAWHVLERAVHLAALEGLQVVLMIDDCDESLHEATQRELDSLTRLGPIAKCGLTIVYFGRGGGGAMGCTREAWSLPIALEPLTRSQADRYLMAKLASAGSSRRLFTPRAITRLHTSAMGVPHDLDQLAACCLMAGAARGLEVIEPDLVDTIAAQLGPRLCVASA
jgi:general secretion pathway protein A